MSKKIQALVPTWTILMVIAIIVFGFGTLAFDDSIKAMIGDLIMIGYFGALFMSNGYDVAMDGLDKPSTIN
jgi:hypothetical protein